MQIDEKFEFYLSNQILLYSDIAGCREGIVEMVLHILVLVCAALSLIEDGNAGLTSSFIRSEWPSIDIPLDNEVFAVPKGYNAPQQVSLYFEGHTI